MNRKFLTGLTILSVIFMLSCKGKQGDVGPQGPQGPAGTSATATSYDYKEGYVKGTATGTRADGTNYTLNLDEEGNLTGDNFYKVVGSETQIQIDKLYSGQGDSMVSCEIGLVFSVPDLNTLTSPTGTGFSIDIIKDLGNSTYFEYSGSSQTPTISNLNYDAGTGVITGKFSVSCPSDVANGYGSLDITNGTFSSKISKVVAKMAAH